MTSPPVQNCFSDAAGATIRIVKGEWDTSNGGGGDPQPRLSVSIPSSQLQFQPYGYPPQVQLLSTSTSQYPSTEDLSGRRGSSSTARNGANNGNGNGNGNTIPTSPASPRTSSDRARKQCNRPKPPGAALAAASTPEPQQSCPSTPKENNRSHKTSKGNEKPSKPKPSDPETSPPLPRPKTKRRRKPTAKLTTHQIFYIFVIDGLGAMILSGAINFAIAYAMYTSHPAGSDAPPILLFHLPNSLAGDAAVTIILQTVITWLVEFFLVRRDIERGGVAPVGFVRIPRGEGNFDGVGDGKGKEEGKGAAAGYDTDMDLEKGNGNQKDSAGENVKGAEKTNRIIWSWNWRSFVRWFCFITDDDDDDDDDDDLNTTNNHNPTKESKQQPQPQPEDNENGGIINRTSTLPSQILRALLISVLMFFLLWGPFVGVLMALGRKDETIGAKGDWVFDSRVWLPQVFKLILGGLLALLETPAFAFFWMVRGGWDFQQQQHRGDKMGVNLETGKENGNGNGVVSAVGMGLGMGMGGG